MYGNEWINCECWSIQYLFVLGYLNLKDKRVATPFTALKL